MKTISIPIKNLISILLAAVIAFIFLSSCQISSGLVSTVEQFHEAVENAEPGDQIVLASGVWENVELIFEGSGTADRPITLSVQEKGKVTLEGQSNLMIAGEYLHVEGLVFKNGYTPTNEVISFRKDKESLANNCRVTECVIDNYNNPERFESDYWVGIYGKNNRFDHNYMTGKRNQGVVLAVRINSEASQENFHRIDHNYFGARPILGSNGGETLRIGTSHYSMTNSKTLVEYNYFDRCDGEHEIISNKSCQNTFRYNTFFECQGTLTMRHGNETLVDNNFFFGNGKPNTGGIRIINEKQKVVNNYCEGLTGYRFRGGLVIMNGVPNSPLNRYFQVKESEASNNSFINCDYVQLCAGSDDERSAIPVSTTVSNNLFYNEEKDDLFTVYDDINGISFSNNVLSPNIATPSWNNRSPGNNSFSHQKLSFERENGLLIPQGDDAMDYGFQGQTERATVENTGVSWYPRVEESIQFGTGQTIHIEPGENTLLDAIRSSTSGDVILLAEGEYLMSKAIDVDHPISIRAVDGIQNAPVIKFQRTTLFNIENGGSLSLAGLIFSGEESEDKPGNAVIRTSRYSMVYNYQLEIRNCKFLDLDVNHSFNVLKVFKNTFAENIVLEDSEFRNITGQVLALDKETDDIGIYNVENVDIANCLFEDIGGVAIKLHRGGGDESTFGPILNINHSVFTNVGRDNRNTDMAAIALHGVQWINIQNSIINDSQPVRLHLVVGEPVVNISNTNIYKSGPIISNSGAYKVEKVTAVDPGWQDAESYSLSDQSALKGAANDGSDLGIIQKTQSE